MRRRGQLTLALVVLVSSCSSQTVDTTVAADGQMADRGPTSTATATTIEPMDLNALAEVLFIDEAEHFRMERAVQACMEGAGFEYNISPYWPWDMFEDAAWRAVANPPPVTGPTQAEQDEYRAARRDISQAQVGWEDAFFGTGRESIDVGNGGILLRSIGGCWDQGRATVMGDPSAWHELMDRVQGVNGEAYAAAEAAPPAQVASDAWSACMRARGYDASSPDDHGGGWSEKPGAGEAFSECLDESGYSTVMDAPRLSVVGDLLQREADAIGPLMARLTNQEPNASQEDGAP